MSALNGGVGADRCGFVSCSPALFSARAEL